MESIRDRFSGAGLTSKAREYTSASAILVLVFETGIQKPQASQHIVWLAPTLGSINGKHFDSYAEGFEGRQD